MITRITNYLTDLLVKHRLISCEDEEIYLYGMTELLNLIVVVALLFAVGIIFEEVWECIIFAACFMGLRKYAGGYHSKTRGRCLVLTVISVVLVLALLRFVKISMFVMCGFMIMNLIIILLLSPVDTKNNRLDNFEKKYCRRKTIIIILVELFLFHVFLKMGCSGLAEAIWGAWGMLAVSLLVESFLERRSRKCEQGTSAKNEQVSTLA